MDHKERIKVANNLSVKMQDKYGDKLEIFGIYGSTSKSNDTSYSDIDLIAIVNRGSNTEKNTFIFKNIAVNYKVITYEELEATLSKPSVEWAPYMGILSEVKVLHGERKVVDKLIEKGKSIPEKIFRKELPRVLPELVMESYGRVLSCQERCFYDDLYVSVIEIILEMNNALCLLNKSWVTHSYFKGVEEAYLFDKLPKDYKNLTKELWKQQTPNLNETVDLVKELVNNYMNLLERENITIKSYDDLDKIEI